MKLDMLAKDESSGDMGCPSCYMGDDKKIYVQAGADRRYRAAGHPRRGGSHPQHLAMPPGAPEFSAWFARFRVSCFRLETLQCYLGSGEDDSIGAFAAGQTPQPHPGKREWMALVGAAVRDGRTMQRVHVVTEPITDYVRFEVAWSYAYSVAAGEDVRIIPVPKGTPWPPEIPTGDFWLFDDAERFDMHYDADGMWTGVEYRRDPVAASVACQVRDAALRLALPWAAYVSARPELARRVPPWLT